MRRYFMLRAASLVLTSALFTGCASTGSSNFSCPAPNTGMCKPIHDVDKMVSDGQLGQDGTSTGKNGIKANQTAGAFDNFSTPYPASIITPGAPLRIQEQIMAVWVAPYQDKQGNYHDPSTLYSVIEPGRWVADPVRAVDGNDSDESSHDDK
ncbi:MAG: type IV conjugative transfer system lipoprotein TraV [Legionellales bacterium]|nr:type IV conjugative transfer system lipoprotein TraV [Legionellales bacterium]